jgi:hypothetical protein
MTKSIPKMIVQIRRICWRDSVRAASPIKRMLFHKSPAPIKYAATCRPAFFCILFSKCHARFFSGLLPSLQEELLLYAMNLVKENVSKRIDAILQSNGIPEQISIRILLELIPYNEESEIEMSVWFHFIMANIHHKQQEDDRVLEEV